MNKLGHHLETMDKIRESLRLDPSVFCIDELGKPIPGGHEIGPKVQYFPAVEASPLASE